MHGEDAEELLLSKRDHCKEDRLIKTAHEREKAFAEKDAGYTEALDRMDSSSGHVEAFFGYVDGLDLDSTEFCTHIAMLLSKSHEALNKTIEHVMTSRMRTRDEIAEALSCQGQDDIHTDT